MGNVSSIVKQLKKERDRIVKQLSGMDAALTAFAGVYSASARKGEATDQRGWPEEDRCRSESALGKSQGRV